MCALTAVFRDVKRSRTASHRGRSRRLPICRSTETVAQVGASPRFVGKLICARFSRNADCLRHRCLHSDKMTYLWRRGTVADQNILMLYITLTVIPHRYHVSIKYGPVSICFALSILRMLQYFLCYWIVSTMSHGRHFVPYNVHIFEHSRSFAGVVFK